MMECTSLDGYEKDESINHEKQRPDYDARTPEEIEKRIDFLESQLAAYKSFNQRHHQTIKQLKDIKFFENSFPSGNSEVLNILELVFTNNHGEGGPWGYVVRELYRRPQRFMKRFDQLRYDVINKESEKNEEIRKLLDEIDIALRPAGFMIVYYWNNTP